MTKHHTQRGSEVSSTAPTRTAIIAPEQEGASAGGKSPARSRRRKRPPTLRLDAPASLDKMQRLGGQLHQVAEKIKEAMKLAIATDNTGRAAAAVAKADEILARAELTQRLLRRLILRSARLEALDLAQIPQVAEIAARALRETARGAAAQSVATLDRRAWRTLLVFATYFVLEVAPVRLLEVPARPDAQGRKGASS